METVREFHVPHLRCPPDHLERLQASLTHHAQTDVDSIPHDELLKSLHNISITGPLLECFANYLTGRCQRVVLQGFHSDYSCVSSGVHQGSILGLLLFIILMNSISQLLPLQRMQIILYADNILLYRPINISNGVELLQKYANTILKWIISHLLTSNHSNTKPLLTSCSKRTISPSSSVQYLAWCHHHFRLALVPTHWEHFCNI